MGLKQDRAWASEPELRLLYEEYCLCRQQDMKIWYRKEKGEKETLMVTPWTMGLSQFPDGGGARDQNYLLTRVFKAFMDGDNEGQLRRLTR